MEPEIPVSEVSDRELFDICQMSIDLDLIFMVQQMLKKMFSFFGKWNLFQMK